MVAGSRPIAPPSEPIGTRLIDSTPPASTRSSQPERTFCAAVLTASRPDAQNRLSCTPPEVTGMPDASTAARAMSPPWSPTGETQPKMTSLIRFSSRSGWRLRSSSITPTTRLNGLTSCNDPFFCLPRGVRMAS
ncbi:Uncharacterised protein [Mycobacterium tuberculosis]|nr:Uncharacterised protein [Mycobacterium tuberculosis]